MHVNGQKKVIWNNAFNLPCCHFVNSYAKFVVFIKYYFNHILFHYNLILLKSTQYHKNLNCLHHHHHHHHKSLPSYVMMQLKIEG